MEKIDLTGKVVLVTGASRGFGKQTAIRIANAGARGGFLRADRARA